MPDEKELKPGNSSDDNGDSKTPELDKMIGQIVRAIESNGQASSGGDEVKASESGDGSEPSENGGSSDDNGDTSLPPNIEKLLEHLFTGSSESNGQASSGGQEANASESGDSVNDLIDNGTLYRFDESTMRANEYFNSLYGGEQGTVAGNGDSSEPSENGGSSDDSDFSLEGGEQGTLSEIGGSSFDIRPSFGEPGFTVSYSGDSGESGNGGASADGGAYGETATGLGDTTGTYARFGSLDLNLSEDEEGNGNDLDSPDDPLDPGDG